MMNSFYRNPKEEDGIHNIILQNRCGNRLTVLFYEDHTNLEFLYKPNAYRRLDFKARNFSTRDNCTFLFKEFSFPEIRAEFTRNFDYDPFVTRIETSTAKESKNLFTFINIADENCFALSAKCPLLLAFKPHGAFNVQDGILTEKFIDRGEEIVSFVRFGSMENNRYRVLQDGTHVIQILGDDVILMGGEENISQVNRVLNKLWGKSAEELISLNEILISNFTDKSKLQINNDDFQRVLDLNKRVNYSIIDEAGVTFGALNRIYHLNWIRDNLMSTSMMALAGTPDLLKRALPYIFDNPSVRELKNGKEIRKYLQMVGTRWGKGEEDGLYYTMYGLYVLYQTTGQDKYIYSEFLHYLTDAIDGVINNRFIEAVGLFGSDTIGETTLKGSPFYGYDAVDGSLEVYFDENNEKNVSFCYTYYQNSNMYNILKMAEVLIKASPDMDESIAKNYSELSEKLRRNIKNRFINDEGYYYAAFIIYEDGEEEWVNVEDNSHFWEHSWANSIGPFIVDTPLSLKTAEKMVEWTKTNWHGLCPVNTLSRILREYGLPSEEYKKLLSQEIIDALTFTEKYPMVGASTEYAKTPETYRGLPFSTGSLMFSLYSLIIQSLPMGIAIRTSTFSDTINNFYYRNSIINAKASGEGETVGVCTLNGEVIEHTLQIPEDVLRFGKNNILIQRTGSYDEFRLYSSSAVLRSVRKNGCIVDFRFNCPTKAELVFENFEKTTDFRLVNLEGVDIEYRTLKIEESNKTIITFDSVGEINVKATL